MLQEKRYERLNLIEFSKLSTYLSLGFIVFSKIWVHWDPRESFYWIQREPEIHFTIDAVCQTSYWAALQVSPSLKPTHRKC